jgi:hypothetical protein
MYEKVIELKSTGHWGRREFKLYITSAGFTCPTTTKRIT